MGGGKGKGKQTAEFKAEKKKLKSEITAATKEITQLQRTLLENKGTFTETNLLANTKDEEIFTALNIPVTDALRLKLDLLFPSIPYHPVFSFSGGGSKVHLCANAGATLGLFLPLLGGDEPLYRCFTLHKPSAPVTWTIVGGAAAMTVVQKVHAATHCFPGEGAGRPRLPPVLGGGVPADGASAVSAGGAGAAGVGSAAGGLAAPAGEPGAGIYITRTTLSAWGVGWKETRQMEGEVVVLGPGTVGEAWFEEVGCLEEGVVGVAGEGEGERGGGFTTRG